MIRNWLKDQKGAVAVEFILLAPIIILMLMAGFEAGRYVMILNKTQSAAFTLANVVAQTAPATVLNEGDSSRLNEDNLTNIITGVDTLMQPFSGTGVPRGVIVTSVQRQGSTNVVRWQSSIGEAFEGASSIVNGRPPGSDAAAGTNAPFNGTITSDLQIMKPGENMLVLEVFFRYRPVFASLLGNFGTAFSERTIAKRVYFYNRLGKALFLPPTYPVTTGGTPTP